ncbi:MAG: hypothetical protein EBT63_04420, partial [Proteobacteria bacterium]|nr:hypothetical protein [Pseudomonadota bacterium]
MTSNHFKKYDLPKVAKVQKLIVPNKVLFKKSYKMVEKYFLNYAKSSSYEGFADIQFSKKIDILFVDSKFDDKQNFCVTLNSNNTCKDALPLDKFSNIGASILLFKIAGDDYKNSQVFYQKLQENIQNFKNYFVIRINHNANISKSLEELLKVSENISDIYYNFLAMGLSGEIYFINNSGVVSNLAINSIASKLRFDIENIVKEAKLSISEFKNFLEKNNYKSLINPDDFDSFFEEEGFDDSTDDSMYSFEEVETMIGRGDATDVGENNKIEAPILENLSNGKASL